MDRARIERLEALLDVARGKVSDWGGPFQVDDARREILNALPALLRLARAVADAPRERMWHAGGGMLVAELTLPAVWTELDDEMVILLRADAADTTAGEG